MSAWSNSTRRARLPKDWPARRALVLERDGYRCQLRYTGICTTEATDVDHVRAGDDHSLANLQAACTACHKRKTIAERPTTRRPVERHPGLKT